MNTTVANYLQKHYAELSRVAEQCCRRAGIPAEAGDVLHEVLLVTLLDPGKQLDYAERVETDPELLLRYLKRIIKLNACSSRAPYRQERDRLETLLDRAAEINALPVADTAGEDRASRVWDVFDRLPLTTLQRDLFLFCYRDNRSPAEWSHPSSPGHGRPLSRTAIYGHLRKVVTLIRETLAFEADES